MSEAYGFELKKDIYTVGEISAILKQVLSSELFMNLKIRGEISQKSEKNGNVYLTLIDSSEESENSLKPKAILKVCIFSWYDQHIETEYKVGDDVVVSGDISYYPPFGSLSLNGKYLYLYGEGMELIKLKRLKEKLEKEGLFAPERKRKLPLRIHKIGIVTSASGAAYHDILETLSRKIPVSTVLFDAVVQGQEAPASLCRALTRAYKSDCDVLIFGRGGGSKTDLGCFNDETVVRKLAASPIPTITGIGHEIDTSLCDLVADVYAITPTAAADKALPDLSLVLDNLKQMSFRLQKAGEGILTERMLELQEANKRLEGVSPRNKMAGMENELKLLNEQLRSSYLSFLNRKELNLKNLDLSLTSAYPLNGLKEGTALIRKKGKPVKSVKELRGGDEVEIGLSDGVKGAIIKEEEK